MSITVADLLVRFAADTSGADRGFNSVNQQVDQFSQKNRGAFDVLQSVGSVAIGGAITGIAALGAGMVSTAISGTKMAAGLESQMDTIASVLGKTEAEVQPLNDLILGLGINPNLKVSTLEAADAIETLATAGLSMAEIIDGAAESTVLLSNATGGDFAQSAEIMTDSMAIFTDSIGSYADAVNGVVSVSNVSKFGVNDYALALASAGGVAGAVGVEFDDFNASIASISPLFSSGSDAGTSFKTMLQRLIPQSDTAADAMADLGLIAADGANQFFDASGSLKDMSEITVLLQGALSGLSEEQRNQALSTIFGTDAMRAAVGLMDSGAVVYTDAAAAAAALGVSQEAVNAVIEGGVTAYEALQLQMGQTDAIDAAAQRMDNAAGAMEILGGVIETVKISIGQAFLPVMKELATQLASFVTDNSERITSFFQTFAQGVAVAASFIPSLVSGLFSLIDVFAGVVQVIGKYIATGELLSAAEFGMGESTAALVDGMTDFIATIVDVVGAIGTFIRPIVTAIARFVSWKDVLITLGVAIAAVVVPAIVAFVAAWAPVIGTIALVIGAVSLLRNAWESDFLGIQTVVTSAVSALVDTFGPYISAVGTAIEAVSHFIRTGELLSAVEFGASESVAALADRFSEFGADVYDAVSSVVSTFAPFVSAVQSAIQVVSHYIRTGELLSAVEFGVGESVAALADRFAEFGADVYDALSSMWSGVQPVLSALWEWLSTNIPSAIDNVLLSVGNSMGMLSDWLRTNIPSALETLSSIWSSVWNALPSVASASWGSIQAVLGSTGDWLRTNIPSALETLSSIWSSVWNALPGIVGGAWAAIQSVLGSMLAWFDGAPLTMERLSAAWQSVWASLSSSVESAREQIGTAWSALSSLFAPAIDRVKAGFAEMVGELDKLAPKFAELWQAIQPVIALIGGALVVVTLTATNLVASLFENMVDLISATIDTLTGVLNGITETIQGMVSLVVAIINGDWAGAWSAAEQIVEGVFGTISSLVTGLDQIVGIALGIVGDTIKNTLSDLGVNVEGFSTSIQTTWSSIWEGMRGTVDTAVTTIGAAWSAIADLFGPAVERIRSGFNEMIASAGSLGPKFGEMGGAFANLWNAVQPILSLLVQGIQQVATTIGGVLVVVALTGTNLIAAAFSHMVDFVSILLDAWTGIINGIAETVRGVVALVQAIIAGDWQAAWDAAGQIVEGIITALSAQFNGLVQLTTLVWGVIADTVSNTLSDLGVDMDGLSANMSASWASMWGGMQSTWDSTWAAISAGWTSLKGWLDTTFPNALTTLSAFWDIGWLAIKVVWDTFWASISEAWTLVQTWLVMTLPQALTGWGAAWDSGWAAIAAKMNTVYAAISALWTSAQTWLVTTLPTALTTVKTAFTDSWEAIRATVVEKIGNISGAMNDIKTWLDSTLRTALDGFKMFLSGISLPDPFSALSGAISGITGAISGAQSALLSYIDWLSNISIPNPFSGVFGGGEEESTGGEVKGGGRSLRTTPVLAVAGGTSFNVDTLAAAISQAMQNAPLTVNLAFSATISGDADAERVSYQMARRISDIIQRRG